MVGYDDRVYVECPSCKARYSLGTALFSGSRGALVRCRKCGDRFEVRNPEPPPETVNIPGTEPEIDRGPPEPSQPPTVAPAFPPPEDRMSPGPYRYQKRISYRVPRRGWARPDGGKALSYIAGLVIIAIGITVGFVVYSKLPRGLLSAPGKTSPEVAIFDTHYDFVAAGSQIFVLRGSVRDTRKGATSPPIRLRVTLLDAKKNVLSEKTFLAGSASMVTGLPEKFALEHVTHQKGWIPFVAVFIDVREIADFSVAVIPDHPM